MYKKYGFVRIGAMVPKLKVANVMFNVEEICKGLNEANENGIQILVTPELSISGYTCADLFQQDILLEECLKGLEKIVEYTKNIDVVCIVGMPLKNQNQLFNVAVVIQNGKILGIVPKTNISNYSGASEQRWFSSSAELKNKNIEILENKVPFDTNIIFQDKENKDINFAIEISEDLFSLYPPSYQHCENGANIIFNLSAIDEIVGKYEQRKCIIQSHSAKTMTAYCFTSSGVNESTTDSVFSGYSMIVEKGKVLAENERFDFESNIIMTDIDIKKIVHQKLLKTNLYHKQTSEDYVFVDIDLKDSIKELKRFYNEYPFVPKEQEEKEKRCNEIFNIQSCSLAKRLLHTNMQKTVIGLSGGLDSTLAFLVIIEAYKKIGLSNKNIIAITMPGFGTTDRTYKNACELVKKYGATLKEISIKDACNQHFKDIGLPEGDKNTTFENSQARERTQILMDIANQKNALVVGTGDLSELALGWCTYNGDHMSMYAVNSGIPKTLVSCLVKWIADREDELKKSVIYDILDTPISPELLPPDEYGNIEQKTEDKIGPYMLHDFFLYHFLRNGNSPEKIYVLAKHVFKNKFSDEEIKKWLITFIKRFFSQQFKRSCMPDGPKVGTVSLSPRSGLRMPSDAEANIWIKNIENL